MTTLLPQAALRVLLEDAGYEAVERGVLRWKVLMVSIAQIRRVASAAVCDHRLSPRGLAHFGGAAACRSAIYG